MAGTCLFADALIHAWIFPFGVPALIKGDHWLLSLDFNLEILFGNKPAVPALGMLHSAKSNNELHMEKFYKEDIVQCNTNHLMEWLDHFTNLQTLEEADICKLETINTTLLQKFYYMPLALLHA